MAPVIRLLKQEPWCECRVLATAQHRQMLDQVLMLFGIAPEIDLDVMRPNQQLSSLTARLLQQFDEVLADERPDMVLAQGDTTTVLAVAIAAFYMRIPFGHVEAGLRTHDLRYPFPEEMNRLVAGQLAHWHFAPTDGARRNLLQEGIKGTQIHVTGNTVIDALLTIAREDHPLPFDLRNDRRLVLITAHRRENFGAPFRSICSAIRELALRNPDVEILYPVHPNPNVRDAAYAELRDHARIHLCEPLDYGPFVTAIKKAYFVLSDSGGLQEEAPALGKPVLVLRTHTERPEAVDEGVVKLVGTSRENILLEAQRLLDDPGAYGAMARGVSPYGDGRAAERIVGILRDYSS